VLDTPADHPGLGFEAYASALKRIIELSDPQFSVGIFGGWGTGKTTLMRAIEKQLSDQIVSVWFNAWRYEKEEHLIIPLLDILRDALVTWAGRTETDLAIDSAFGDRAIKAASTIAKAARAISAGTAIKTQIAPLSEGPRDSVDASKMVAEGQRSTSESDRQDAESPQSSYHASFKALQEALTEFTEHGKQRIVVFIDDLDRCLPSNALEVLESMKLFFDLEGFVFVVGLDQDVIEASVDWKYRFSHRSTDTQAVPPISGADYIRKIFQVPFILPAISSVQLDDYLADIFSSDDEDAEERDSLLRPIRPHLDFLVGYSGVNPREIKRYINAYILQKLIQPDLDDDATLVLQTIAFRADWRDAYRALRSERSTFIEATKRQLSGEEDSLKRLNPRLENLPDSFFSYINTPAGQKLLDLDVPQLEQQMRTFETIQPVEDDDIPTYLYGAIDNARQRLVESAAQMDDLNPGVLSDFRAFFEQFRDYIRRLERLLLDLRQVDRELANRGSQKLRALKDQVDTQQFIFSRSDGDLQTEDFEKVLDRRSKIASLIAELDDILQDLQQLLKQRPPSGRRVYGDAAS
jgi:hypothetical protein